MPAPTFITSPPSVNSPNTITTNFVSFYVVTAGKMCMQVYIDLFNSHDNDVLISLWVTPESNQDNSIANKRYSKTFAPQESDKVTYRLLPGGSRLFAAASLSGVASIRVVAVEI